MPVPRRKPLLLGGVCLLVVWLLAGGGYLLARNARVTPEKIRTYLRTVDLTRLSGPERAKALRKLAAMLNALPYEQRREARLDRAWSAWFAVMTGPEQGEFIEATVPTGFKQMLNAFEDLPADKRKRAIDDTLKRLKEARTQLASGDFPGPEGETNAAPALSDEMREKITTVGLKSYYSQSSAQTKADMAPVLEELQQLMESGALFRNRMAPHD